MNLSPQRPLDVSVSFFAGDNPKVVRHFATNRYDEDRTIAQVVSEALVYAKEHPNHESHVMIFDRSDGTFTDTTLADLEARGGFAEGAFDAAA